MNFDRYPWLADLSSADAAAAIEKAREQYRRSGAVTFDEFITRKALKNCADEARAQEDDAFTTDDMHTAHLLPVDPGFPADSVRNYQMRTQVASIAFDELPKNSELAALYKHPTLRKLVGTIVHGDASKLYLSDDPLGCCSVNVFRPQYHHSFHFDESEFSTTLMLQEAQKGGLFQYTRPIRDTADDLALESIAAALRSYGGPIASANGEMFCEAQKPAPTLNTLQFTPGTLSIFSGSKSLHRVTIVEGDRSRLVAVLTFASQPGFRNSAKVQKLFWGRSVPE